MSTFERMYLKFIESFIAILFNITGLWPYTYNLEIRKFQLNLCYLLFPFVIVSYALIIFFVQTDKMFHGIESLFKNVILKITSNIYVASNIGHFCLIYLSQYFYYNRTKLLLYKARSFYENFSGLFTLSEYNYLPLLIKFTVKSFLLGISLVIVVFISVMLIAPSLSWLSVIGYILPVVIVKIYPDVYFGGLLIADFFLRIMNNKLREIISSAPERNGFDKVLNNKFEIISIVYVELIEIVNAFNQIMSRRIVFWLLLGISNFIVQLFMQYVNIIKKIKDGTFSNSTISYCGIVILCVQYLEYWFTASVGSTVLKEFDKTQYILCSLRIRRCCGKMKFGRSAHLSLQVENFSERLLHQKLRITGCGMFNIDLRLFYSVCFRGRFSVSNIISNCLFSDYNHRNFICRYINSI